MNQWKSIFSENESRPTCTPSILLSNQIEKLVDDQNGLSGPLGLKKRSTCKPECFARKYHSYHSYGETNMKPFEGFLNNLYESNGKQNDDLYNHSQRFIFVSQNNQICSFNFL